MKNARKESDIVEGDDDEAQSALTEVRRSEGIPRSSRALVKNSKPIGEKCQAGTYILDNQAQIIATAPRRSPAVGRRSLKPVGLEGCLNEASWSLSIYEQPPATDVLSFD